MSELFVPKKPASFSSLEELEALVLESDGDGEEIEMNSLEWERLRLDLERDSLLNRKVS